MTEATTATHVWVYNPQQSADDEEMNEEQLFAGTLIHANDQFATILHMNQEKQIAKPCVYLKNPQHTEAAHDVTTLTYLHEPGLLHNLNLRYEQQQIYTYTGSILIAVNPFQTLPALYNDAVLKSYIGQQFGQLPPHVYAIAEHAYRNVIQYQTNQSVLVSGESGAGKTETSKYLLSYFAAMGNLHKSQQPSIEQQVLSSTPLLEAFGNAKTLRNDNSSRYGKFIQILFNKQGQIVGADIKTYLLEKSRLVRQAIGERNYHIFYQLLEGSTQRDALGLTGDANDYHYLNQSECSKIDQISDEEQYRVTLKAMKVIGITDVEQTQIETVLAAILHVGNLTFAWDEKANACSMDNDGALQKACDLLQLDSEALRKTLLTRNVTAGKESYTVNLTLDQAESARDAIAMLLYSRLFDWLVKRINENIYTPKFDHFIGILDIYGFESFKTNSFEQFCINYANEKLQQQYNHHVFKLSQQEYVEEQISWANIEFVDNQICLDMIEKGNLCVLSLLDEETRFPQSNEKTLAQKLYKNHLQHSHFAKPRFSDLEFSIRHYADMVTYNTNSFLDKNKDFIIPEQVALLEASKSAICKNLFPPQKQRNKNKTSFQFSSVSSQFKQSLAQLMEIINKTYPHYIRCIKPNSQKKANTFSKRMVLQQLKCGGILESVRICLQGYPYKQPFSEFNQRYQLLARSKVPLDAKSITEHILKTVSLDTNKYQFGKSKIFMRAGQVEILEGMRHEKLRKSAICAQANVRAYLGKKKYALIRSSILHLQQVVRIQQAREDYLVLKKCHFTTQLQAMERCKAIQTAQVQNRSCAAKIQCLYRGVKGRRVAKAKQKLVAAAVVIQSVLKGHAIRKFSKQAINDAKSLDFVQKQKLALEQRIKELESTKPVVIVETPKQQSEDLQQLIHDLQQKCDKYEEQLNTLLEQVQDACKKQQVAEEQVETLKKQLQNVTPTTIIKEVPVANNSASPQYLEEMNRLRGYINTLEQQLAEKDSSISNAPPISTTALQEKEYLIEKLLQDLALERKSRIEAQQRNIALEHDRAMKPQSSSSDLDKLISKLYGHNTEEQTQQLIAYAVFENQMRFVQHVPVCAHMLYQIIRSVHVKRTTYQHSILCFAIKALREAVKRYPLDLPYWMSNVTYLLQHLASFDFVTLQDSFSSQTLAIIHEELTQCLSSGYAPLGGSGSNHTKLQDQLLELVNVFQKTYAAMLESMCTQLAPLVKQTILHDEQQLNLVMHIIKNYISMLKKNFVPHVVIENLVTDVAHFVDCSLFNEVLRIKELNTAGKGAQMKMCLATIEQELKALTGNKEYHLYHVRQVSTILLVQKDMLSQAETRQEVAPLLNTNQVLKILSQYAPDAWEKPISKETLYLLQSTANRQDPLFLVPHRGVSYFQNLADLYHSPDCAVALSTMDGAKKKNCTKWIQLVK